MELAPYLYSLSLLRIGIMLNQVCPDTDLIDDEEYPLLVLQDLEIFLDERNPLQPFQGFYQINNRV